jgi:hypothetical protein
VISRTANHAIGSARSRGAFRRIWQAHLAISQAKPTPNHSANGLPARAG